MIEFEICKINNDTVITFCATINRMNVAIIRQQLMIRNTTEYGKEQLVSFSRRNMIKAADNRISCNINSGFLNECLTSLQSQELVTNP